MTGRQLIGRRLAVIVLVLCLPGKLSGQNMGVTPLTGKNVSLMERPHLLQVGSRAPIFEVRDLNGNSYTFSQTEGNQQFLMVFWSVFCEPSRFEMPIIENLHRKYRGQGLEVLAVAIDGDPLKNTVAGFVKQEGYSFRVLIDGLDENGFFNVADPYGVVGTPTLFIVNKSGIISFANEGAITEKQLDNEIVNILKQSGR